MRTKGWLSKLPKVFWVLAALTVVVWAAQPGYVVGWDLNVYKAALLSLRAGHDPYADGIAIQRVFHAHLAEHPEAPTPFTYVYSPVTLPVLRALGRLPLGLLGAGYWTVYALLVLVPTLALWQFVEPGERRVFRFLVPAVLFFPGLLQQDVLFSGNIAYVLYGLVFAAAHRGWQRGRWHWFYAAVFLASCCKAPLLVLLLLPVLSARRQVVPAAATGALGVAAFLLQPHVWPVLFRHYLEAVELQFSFNHDFSSSPNGLLADALFYRVPYRVTSAGFYLFYAVPLVALLVYLSRRYFAGALTARQWVPVLVLGVFFLYPRLMEYDAAPMTLAMLTVGWRVFAGDGSVAARASTRASIRWPALGLRLLFVGANALALVAWRPAECLLLVGLFFAGAARLLVLARRAGAEGADAVAAWEAEDSGLRRYA